MNSLDKQYQDLLQAILDFGVEKKDRTGTGTKSIFGYTIRHKMSDGFPLLTTKKMAWKTIVTELLWFLRGDTNIKYLVDNDCNIWNGDAYKNYLADYTADTPYRVAYFSEEVKFRPYTLEEFINNIKTNNEFAKQWGELGPIYGAQWRDWNGKTEVTYPGERDENEHLKPFHIKTYGIDQISELIRLLKETPDSRRMVVNAWAVHDLPKMTLPPCHYGFQIYTRELSFEERASRSYFYSKLPAQTDMPTLSSFVADILPTDEKGWSNLFDEFNIPTRAISLMWNQRSVDTFLGLPFNIASYGLLLEILAKEVNMVPDELIGNLGDTHLYLNHIEQAKEQIERTSFELPKLIINDEFWNPDDSIINQISHITPDDFIIDKYQSHPIIKAPLSN